MELSVKSRATLGPRDSATHRPHYLATDITARKTTVVHLSVGSAAAAT